MKFTDIREQVIKQFIIKELLDESIYPSLELVCAMLIRDYQNSNIGQCLLLNKHLIVNGETASARKINEIMKLMDIDIQTLYKFIEYLEKLYTDSQSAALQKINALNRLCAELESYAKAILLSNTDVSGTTEIISESFYNTGKIDLLNTTANVDVSKNEITARKENIKTYTNFASYVINPIITTSTSNIKIIQDKDITNAFDNSLATYFIYKAYTPDQGIFEISIKLPLKKVIELSQLSMDLCGSKYDVSLVMRVNGIYNNIANYATYTDQCVINFDPVETDYIIIKLRSASGTKCNAGIEYIFNLNNIRFSKLNFSSESIFTTSEINTDSDFSIIGLYTEETIPNTGNILYTVHWKTENNGIASWHTSSIFPYNHSGIDLTKYLNIDESSESIISIKTIDFTLVHPYICKANISTTATLDSDQYNNLRYVQPKLLRNLGGFDIFNSDTGIITTVLYVVSDFTVDFSLIPGIITGGSYKNYKITNKLSLSPGFYTFSFNSSNLISTYKTYLDSIVGDNFKYGSNVASYVIPQDFINRIEDNNYNVHTILPNKDGGYNLVIKMLNGNVTSDTTWDKESMLFVYASFSPNQIGKAVKLVAKITSSGTETPKLKQFKIKLS